MYLENKKNPNLQKTTYKENNLKTKNEIESYFFIIVRILQCLYKYPIKGKLQGNKRKS